MGTKKIRRGRADSVPRPAAPLPADELPRVLSFALSARERADVLRVLRGYGSDRGSDRTEALLAALGLESNSPQRGRARG